MPKNKKNYNQGDNLPDEELSTSVNTETTEPEKAPETEAETEAMEKMVPESELIAETDKYLRLAAEFDNFKKRSQRERQALCTDIRCDTIYKILPVYDNLARALNQETEDTAYKKGVEMTMSQLNEVLSDMGVQAIDALGKTFDPLLHNAVMHMDDENYGEKEIVEEFEKGFIMGERVIRFSVVKVAN
jgi:molecular chaperone GrpE